MKKKKVLIIVAHPDDELIWFGNTIHHLFSSARCETNIICLSGNDESFSRFSQFNKVINKIAHNFAIVGPSIKSVTQQLSVQDLLHQGLDQIDASIDEFDLIITHSSYGDEHGHPHHKNISRFIRKLCLGKDIPYAFFSSLFIPGYLHKQIALETRASKNIILNNMFKVYFNPLNSWFFLKNFIYRLNLFSIKYAVELHFTENTKKFLLEIYKDIFLETVDGYSSINHSSELIYFNSKYGKDIFLDCIDFKNLQQKSHPNLFNQQSSILQTVKNKLDFRIKKL